jgi:hypothetical protein
MVMVPLAEPAAVGANETLKVALWPAVKVTGAVIPVRLNPAPLVIATWEMVKLAPPVFVTVSDRVCLLPTCTVPKLKLVGLEVRGPAAAPVPDRAMFNVGFDAVELIVMVPLAAPAAVGANETLKVAL